MIMVFTLNWFLETKIISNTNRNLYYIKTKILNKGKMLGMTN